MVKLVCSRSRRPVRSGQQDPDYDGDYVIVQYFFDEWFGDGFGENRGQQ